MRGRWRTLGSTRARTLALILAGGAIITAFLLRPQDRLAHGSTASAQPTASIAPDTYLGVMGLRQELSLMPQDLAAMGCSQAQAQNVLSTILNWYQTNKPSLDQAQLNVINARRQLQQAVQKIHMGPRDEALISQVPTLEAQVASMQSQRQSLLAQAVNQVAGQLNGSQVQLWANARANVEAPDRYRYVPGLSPQTIQHLDTAVRLYGPNSPKFASIEASLINASQQLSLQQAQANQQQYAAQEQQVENQVLPMPASLMPQPTPPRALQGP